MTEEYKKLEEIRKDFEKDYMESPCGWYINGTGIVSLREFKKSGQKLELKEHESLDDLCLHVTLSRELPSNMKLPNLYKNIRVFYEINGELKLE